MMYCSKCGNQMNEEIYCSRCGQKEIKVYQNMQSEAEDAGEVFEDVMYRTVEC